MQTTVYTGSSRPANRLPSVPSVTERRDAYFFDAMPGEHVSIRVHSEQVAGHFSIVESVASPGCRVPLHSHVEEEVFYIIDGKPTFRLGDMIMEAGPGATIIIPSKTPHAWINRTESDVRMIAIFAPGGIEKFFPQVAGLPLDKVAAVAARFGTTVIGPSMAL